ncbi:phosphocarrier protein HPr [Blastopirellula marina]|uniref:Phosphocarrier protein HPr n=1 Tax=Blastopirellula marina TaxID=124 RepID=A0A2S8FU95_9BACT|nr:MULTISPECIES: HPr family phosphocarrier protein [Pirellulaceae]PQO35751.1 phosphocarrier protein HPr [Blastopirellula marina]RCS53325.1 HPr family phosphocarrier protein [Bremerella cremea]
MGDESIIRKVVVPNRQGLHARPANMFVKVALQYQSQVEITRDGLKVSGKSILDVMTLAAEQGTELTIIVTGPDAETAADALVDVVKRFIEEDDEENET